LNSGKKSDFCAKIKFEGFSLIYKILEAQGLIEEVLYIFVESYKR